MTDGEAEALPTPCEGYGYCPDELVDPGIGPWMPVPGEAVLSHALGHFLTYWALSRPDCSSRLDHSIRSAPNGSSFVARRPGM